MTRYHDKIQLVAFECQSTIKDLPENTISNEAKLLKSCAEHNLYLGSRQFEIIELQMNFLKHTVELNLNLGNSVKSL